MKQKSYGNKTTDKDEADGLNDLQLLGTQDAVFSCFAMAAGIETLFL